MSSCAQNIRDIAYWATYHAFECTCVGIIKVGSSGMSHKHNCESILNISPPSHMLWDTQCTQITSSHTLMTAPHLGRGGVMGSHASSTRASCRAQRRNQAGRIVLCDLLKSKQVWKGVYHDTCRATSYMLHMSNVENGTLPQASSCGHHQLYCFHSQSVQHPKNETMQPYVSMNGCMMKTACGPCAHTVPCTASA